MHNASTDTIQYFYAKSHSKITICWTEPVKIDDTPDTERQDTEISLCSLSPLHVAVVFTNVISKITSLTDNI